MINQLAFKNNIKTNQLYYLRADIDSEGDFILEGLPAELDYFNLQIAPNNEEYGHNRGTYWRYKEDKITPWEDTKTFVIKKSAQAHIHALDAQTLEPITSFDYLRIVSIKNKVPLHMQNKFLHINYPDGLLELLIPQRNAFTTVFLRAEGYVDAFVHLDTAVSGNIVEQEVMMKPAGMLRGNVVDKSGKVIHGAEIFIGTSNIHADNRTDEYGDFYVPLEEGDYNIFATYSKNACAQQEAHIETSRETYVTFVLGKGAQLKGHITKNGLNISAKIECTITQPDGTTQNMNGETNKEGNYCLEGLPDGTGTITISIITSPNDIQMKTFAIQVTKGMETVVNYGFT